ncbi:hypothetical protein EW146_g326 [Bondarzewia mesenterica]|uniref:Intradiol ring-cleavage dioxygenases domain-containing protein n=1 Tax=Bondarzewia mesenterica TaxID=1095465 RepID=A0A4S4M8T5_9AGAM|nr:hypothetical protein EW146_g326 [Bondarzewia mesenterica]
MSVSSKPASQTASNGIPPPKLDLPYPDRPEVVTANLLRLTELVPEPRTKEIFTGLVTHLHQFVQEANLTTEEWMKGIRFLTEVGQKCTDLRQEYIMLSDVLGVSALVDTMNNPPLKNATESCLIGPAYTDDAPDVGHGGTIIDDEKGIGNAEYMYLEGRVLTTDGKPINDAIIESWETDENGIYDVQYDVRDKPNGRGRLRTDSEGNFALRGIVPLAYPLPDDGPVGKLLKVWNRHNMRAAHLHLIIKAPGFRTLTTQLYPEGDRWANTDVVFGPKKSLIVTLKEVGDANEAVQRGIPGGAPFKLLQYDFVLPSEAEAEEARFLSTS